MKFLRSFLIFITVICFNSNLLAWTSSNEGVCYTMDTLCFLSDSINFNSIDNLYEVNCNIVILNSDTLKLIPGDTIKFIQILAPPIFIKYNLIIYGNLQAIGNKDKIIFLGDPESDWGIGNAWNGIQIYNTSKNGESVLKYCIITKAKLEGINEQTSVFIENSSPIIDNCTFCLISSGDLTGGCSAIGLRGQSYPVISNCTFKEIANGVAIWCNPFEYQDTVNYPSPLIYNCNIMKSVQGIYWPPSYNNHVILYGGFLDNCYLGIPFSNLADTSLGYPIDTIGDGICQTISTCTSTPRYYLVDGVVNPRSDTLLTGVNEEETEILPTTTQYLTLSNFPNPFNRATIIQFEVNKQQADICLYIYDSRGNLVNKLIENKMYSKGRHEVSWNIDDSMGGSISSGIYFYKLIANGQMCVKKAILVK